MTAPYYLPTASENTNKFKLKIFTQSTKIEKVRLRKRMQVEAIDQQE